MHIHSFIEIWMQPDWLGYDKNQCYNIVNFHNKAVMFIKLSVFHNLYVDSNKLSL